MKWFDGHLDLAYLAEAGRDFAKEADACGGSLQPAAVTFPSLAKGNVRGALATIFIQRRVTAEEAKRQGDDPEDGPWCFDTPAEAGRAARRQLAIYQRWEQEGWIEIKSRTTNHEPRTTNSKTAAPLKVVILMEGASGIQQLDDMDEFHAAGVRIASLTWAEGSPWSGGNSTGGDVTPAGRGLLARMDQLGMIHDVSHLSEQAFWTVMQTTRGIKVASHSNCRSLLPEAKSPERHLSDDQIRALVNSGGIIGINLYSNFLVADGSGKRATIADVLRHLQHMEKITGRRDFLALGTDMDGGFSRDKLPADLNGPEHLHRLAAALSAAGWNDAEIERFAWGNWDRLLAGVGVRMG